MPRHVDSEARRREVARAVWRVVRRSGLANASVRAVAKEAGLSVGSLRHYFAKQRELQIYAFELINERAEQRLAGVDMTAPIRERIENMMWALLPVTAEQVDEECVSLAFLIESRTSPDLAAIVRDDRAAAYDLTHRAISGLRDTGQSDPNLDVKATAIELLALLDGLALARALNPSSMPVEQLKATVIRWLDNLAADR